jgi:hypothetical protein
LTVHAAVAPPARSRRKKLVGALAVLGSSIALAAVPAQAAQADPPPNDAPTAPAGFESVTAENGRPSDLQAVAQLEESTPDQGVPRCLGPASFARTVWYAVPPAEQPQEITVEASGNTLDVIDLAAFVQPPNANPASPLTRQPNVCDGAGAGGATAAEEPTSGVSLRVPAGRAVLIQVGRRGPVGSPDDERVILSLDDRTVTAPAVAPAGDYADPGTLGVGPDSSTIVPLFGATITQDDPAEPPCPSLGSIWRRLKPDKHKPAVPRLITVNGDDATTLAVFRSPSPTLGNALDCVNRSGRGSLQMLIPAAEARKQLWLSIGTDRPVEESAASLRVQPGVGAFVVDGGPGGSDPTPGGPGGGLPDDCAKADAQRAGFGGATFHGSFKRLNKRRSLSIPVTVTKGPVCDVLLELVGPRGTVYASSRALRIKSGKHFLALTRPAGTKLVRGGYALRVTALSRTGEYVLVRSTLRARLA